MLSPRWSHESGEFTAVNFPPPSEAVAHDRELQSGQQSIADCSPLTGSTWSDTRDTESVLVTCISKCVSNAGGIERLSIIWQSLVLMFFCNKLAGVLKKQLRQCDKFMISRGGFEDVLTPLDNPGGLPAYFQETLKCSLPGMFHQFDGSPTNRSRCSVQFRKIPGRFSRHSNADRHATEVSRWGGHHPRSCCSATAEHMVGQVTNHPNNGSVNIPLFNV